MVAAAVAALVPIIRFVLMVNVFVLLIVPGNVLAIAMVVAAPVALLIHQRFAREIQPWLVQAHFLRVYPHIAVVLQSPE
jgi:hypothetical protein